MPMVLVGELFDLLIQIGCRGQMLDQDRQRIDRNQLGSIRRERWQEFAQTLDQDGCVFLIRGMVIAELEPELSFHSVSSIPWVYRTYKERFYPSHINVADWVLQNRGLNRYIPFGTCTDARSYNEYVAEREDIRRFGQKRNVLRAARIDAQEAASKRRKKERLENYVERLKQGKERAARVHEINAKLATVPIAKRLEIIANSDVPLEAIPKDLLVNARDVAQSLDAETKSNLIQIIGKRNRGVWGHIKRALI